MSKHSTRMAPRMRDVDPLDEDRRALEEQFKHRSDPKVACLLYNTHPNMGEQDVLGPFVHLSLWELKQMLLKQGYAVGVAHLLVNIPHGPVTHKEAYVLPFCKAPTRDELFGLMGKRGEYVSGLTAIGHDVAQALWTRFR